MDFVRGHKVKPGMLWERREDEMKNSILGIGPRSGWADRDLRELFFRRVLGF